VPENAKNSDAITVARNIIDAPFISAIGTIARRIRDYSLQFLFSRMM
jgi:hypothetical protein